ncbi:MAG: type IX secretion system membrane protein PorP/SprF [Flavobacteriales bacterium]|nr:type IX secretion system membrane protein PorP/SprF [Flavobacteriales bacterium]
MMKYIVSAAFLFVGVATFAQQDAQFTQNMFNKLSVNPGYAGANGGICGTFLSRTQWTGFDGHPSTNLFSGDALIFYKHCIGLTVFQDKLGIESSLAAKLAYSYHLTLGPGSLGIGLEAGYLNKSFGTDFIAVDNPVDDPSIPNAGTSAGTFDLGLGVYYNVPNKMYVGISTLHLTASELKDVADAGGKGALNYAQSRHYYIMAGYDWDINNDKKWVVKPSILAKTDGSSTILDINGLLLYNNLVWGGVTYRIEDAVAVLAGVNIPQVPGLKIGAAYDITMSTLGDYSNGSIEFMIKYCTNVSKTPKREVYHSVRFL